MLLILPAQWERALLRGELRERGYDALGAPDLEAALVYRPAEPGRGPVRLLVLDQGVAEAAGALAAVRARHGEPPVLLVASPSRAAPAGPWTVVLRRPVSVGETVAAVRRLLPLSAEMSQPLDR